MIYIIHIYYYRCYNIRLLHTHTHTQYVIPTYIYLLPGNRVSCRAVGRPLREENPGRRAALDSVAPSRPDTILHRPELIVSLPVPSRTRAHTAQYYNLSSFFFFLYTRTRYIIIYYIYNNGLAPTHTHIFFSRFLLYFLIVPNRFFLWRHVSCDRCNNERAHPPRTGRD